MSEDRRKRHAPGEDGRARCGRVVDSGRVVDQVAATCGSCVALAELEEARGVRREECERRAARHAAKAEKLRAGVVRGLRDLSYGQVVDAERRIEREVEEERKARAELRKVRP